MVMKSSLLTKTQADYLNVPVEGPYEPERIGINFLAAVYDGHTHIG
jgi:hypothetical protein